MVEELKSRDRDVAVELLSVAFTDYPVMRFLLRDAGADYARQLRCLSGYFCDKRLLRGWPLRGVRDRGAIVAVAAATPPEPGPAPVAVETARRELRDAIGPSAADRLERYERQSVVGIPDTPHFYLGMLGVSPACQGHGLGRVLLEDLHARSAAHPRSTGVCLHTETEHNVGLYEHVGYRVTGEADIESMHTWCLFRADS